MQMPKAIAPVIGQQWARLSCEAQLCKGPDAILAKGTGFGHAQSFQMGLLHLPLPTPNNTVWVNCTKSPKAGQRAMMMALGLARTSEASLCPVLTPISWCSPRFTGLGCATTRPPPALGSGTIQGQVQSDQGETEEREPDAGSTEVGTGSPQVGTDNPEMGAQAAPRWAQKSPQVGTGSSPGGGRQP